MALTNAERQARFRRRRAREMREAAHRLRRLERELASLRMDVALYLKAGEILRESGVVPATVVDAMMGRLSGDGVPVREE